MAESMNVAAMPKTASFQMRINPEVKQRAEEIFARCGLTLTDAVNIFLQQSLNTGGLPFWSRKTASKHCMNRRSPC